MKLFTYYHSEFLADIVGKY